MSELSLLAEAISLGAENRHGFSCSCFSKIVYGKMFSNQKTGIQGKRYIDVLVEAFYIRFKSNN